MKRAARILAPAVALFLVTAALADEPRQATMIQDVVAGESHVNGKARWDSVVFGQLSSACWLRGPERKLELGEKAGLEPRANAGDCRAISAWVNNTSGLPIYCRAVLKLNQPDDSGRTEITGQRLVMPGAMESVATSYGEAARAPKALTECEVSESPLPPPPSCSFKLLSVPDPDFFYPAESKQREEQGDVTLDFRVDSDAGKLRDIRVSQSSGHPLLDIAALRVGLQIRASETCPENRHRVKVKFRVKRAEPTPLPAPPPAG